MKIYVVLDNHGHLEGVYKNREDAEKAAKFENYHANMRGDYITYRVEETELKG